MRPLGCVGSGDEVEGPWALRREKGRDEGLWEGEGAVLSKGHLHNRVSSAMVTVFHVRSSDLILELKVCTF